MGLSIRARQAGASRCGSEPVEEDPSSAATNNSDPPANLMCLLVGMALVGMALDWEVWLT